MDNVYSRHHAKNGVMQLRVSARGKVLLLGLTILCIIAYFGFRSEWFQKTYLYPYPYRSLVCEYAEERKLDASLVAGVILSESKFKLEARSHKGALGLMQLMPDTAKWIAEQIDDDQFSLGDLNDPEINIRFGTWYLASLKKEFHGNEVLILAAYNAGRGNVKEWMRKYRWDMSFKDIDQIPYQETREYVSKVLKSKEKYRRLYP